MSKDSAELNNFDDQIRGFLFAEMFCHDRMKMDEMRDRNYILEYEFYFRNLLLKEIWHRQLIKTVESVKIKILRKAERDESFELLVLDTQATVD